MIVKCSNCGKELKLLNTEPGIPSLDLWFGNVCIPCHEVFCNDCIEVGGPTPCPKCKTPTKPAQRRNLNEIGLA